MGGHVLNNFLIDVKRISSLAEGRRRLDVQPSDGSSFSFAVGFHSCCSESRSQLKLQHRSFHSGFLKNKTTTTSTCTKNKNVVQVDLSWSDADQSGPCEEKEAEPQPRGLAAEAAEVKGQTALCVLSKLAGVSCSSFKKQEMVTS